MLERPVDSYSHRNSYSHHSMKSRTSHESERKNRSKSRDLCKREKTTKVEKRNRSRSKDRFRNKSSSDEEKRYEGRIKKSSFRENTYSNSPEIESPISTKNEEIHYPWYKGQSKVEPVVNEVISCPKIESYDEYMKNYTSSKWNPDKSSAAFSNSYRENFDDESQTNSFSVKSIKSEMLPYNLIHNKKRTEKRKESFPVSYRSQDKDQFESIEDKYTVIDYDHMTTSEEKADEFRRLGDKFKVIDYGHNKSKADKVVLVSYIMGNNHDTLMEYGNVIPTLFNEINIPKNPIPFPRKKPFHQQNNEVDRLKGKTITAPLRTIPKDFIPCPRRMIENELNSFDYQIKVLADSISGNSQSEVAPAIAEKPWKLIPLESTVCIGLMKGFINRYNCHEKDPRRPEELNILDDLPIGRL